MTYIVMELQTGTATATLVNQYGDRAAAESAFHGILASAAVSSVPVHAAVLMTEEGFVLRKECYKHTPAPVEPEPEPEVEE